MINKLRKVFFIFSQLTLTELFHVARMRIFRDKTELVKSTYQFLEDRFKDNSLIVKQGLLSIISVNLNSVRVNLFLRRFSSDVLVYRQIIINKEFEPVIDLFKKHDFIPEFIMDGGGNIGLTTVYLKCFYPKAKIVLIEPNHSNFAILKRNLVSNDLSDCIPMRCGLWSENTSLTNGKNLVGDEWGFTVIRRQSNDEVDIEGRTIQSILDELNWPGFDYLKLDIEGAEEEVFKQFEVYDLFMTRTRAISIEPHTEEFAKRFKEILFNYNFTIHEFGELIVGFKKDYSS